MGDKGLPGLDSDNGQAMNNLSTSAEQHAATNAPSDRRHNLLAENNEILKNNWREVETTIRRKWEYALDHGLFTDLEFIIGKRRETIKAHSLIFNLQSSKFAEKFPNGDYKEEFDWIEPGPFRHFLKYLYTETINVGIEDALWILFIANYFEIKKLVKICEEKIMKDISIESAAFVYQKGADFECTKLEELAKEYIIKHAASVFETDGILQLTSDSIQAVLKSPAKKINEVQAFLGILKWAKAQYRREHFGDIGETMGINMQMPEPTWTAEDVTNDLRNILSPIIGHINFQEFSDREFALYVVPSKILSYEKTTAILTELTLRKYAPESAGAAAGACSSLPLNIQSELYTLDRYKGPLVDEFWREEVGTDKISFKTSKQVAIVGLGLFGSSEGGNEKPEKIEATITSYDENTTISTCAKELVLPKPAGVFELRFDKPVQVAAGEWYTIHVKMAQVKPYGTGGRKKYETAVGDGVVVWDFMNAKGIAGFSLGRGQIPKILFSA